MAFWLTKMQKKKLYLRNYILQKRRIIRLNEMILTTPKNKKRYSAQIKECEKTAEEIEKKISRLDNDLLREVLFLKYVCGKSLVEISDIISYSRRHTERLHIMALEEFKL